MNLYEYLAQKTAKAVCEEENSDRYQKVLYGAHATYIMVGKTLLLFLLAFFLHLLPPVILFVVCTAMLRIYSFGAHMPNTILCTLVGLLQYLGGSWLALQIQCPWWVRFLVLLVCAVVFYRYAPADTKKRPIAEHQRKGFRKKSLCMFAFVGASSFIFPIFFPWWTGNIPVLAAISQSIFLLPLCQSKEEENQENHIEE